jgi:transcriptional regulator with XRE-family HTH domain
VREDQGDISRGYSYAVGVEAGSLNRGAELPGTSRIGTRLREERKRQGITVREMARRIGVSPSLISQIERDIVNPSVATLYALVTELGVSMNDVFANGVAPARRSQMGEPGPESLTVAPGDRKVINLASGVRWERLTATDDSATEFLYVVYEPGGASCPEDALVHHEGKEYGYVVSGRLGVRIAFNAYELEPGMSISFDSSSPHRLWAIGDKPAEAIWFVVGRQSDSRSTRA